MPGAVFVDNWHIDAITEHLTACYKREIKKLVINIYPRSTKSTITSVLFPAWVWTRNPTESFYCASFAAKLALRDAQYCRELIVSPEYQSRNDVSIQSDQSAVSYYKNNKGGYRISVGTGAQITGFGGSIRILDDPNDTSQTESEVIRGGTNEWFTRTWTSRFNDPLNDVSIVIQQRVHEDDVTGYILQKDLGYEILKIPFRYTGQKYFTSINWSDPREEVGELADKNRFNEEVAKQFEKALGIDAAAQLQQEPAIVTGDWFKRVPEEVDALPNNLELFCFWDKAFTLGGGAYTVGVLMGKERKALDYYVIDVVRGQWDSYLRDKVIRETADEHKEIYGRVRVGLEQEPGSAGRDSCALLIKQLAPHPAKAIPVTGDKELRAHGFNSQWEAGNVKLYKGGAKQGSWITQYLVELRGFPYGKYKDQVDASSGAFNALAGQVTVKVYH